jgi:hypothetical protein
VHSPLTHQKAFPLLVGELLSMGCIGRNSNFRGGEKASDDLQKKKVKLKDSYDPKGKTLACRKEILGGAHFPFT